MNHVYKLNWVNEAPLYDSYIKDYVKVILKAKYLVAREKGQGPKCSSQSDLVKTAIGWFQSSWSFPPNITSESFYEPESINFFCCFFATKGVNSILKDHDLLFHFYKTCLVSFKSPMSLLWFSAVFIYLKSPNWQHLLCHIPHHGKLQAGAIADFVSMYLWIP